MARETPLEFMHSQVFGLEVTEEQIAEQAKLPKPRQEDILFGPIARRWHKEHPTRPINPDDDYNLLGC